VARSLEELLSAVTENARELVGAHQAAASLVVGQRWSRALHAVSLSDKYAAWRGYDARPDGSGIYRLVCQLNRPMRLTQAELEMHPAWRRFGSAASRHPPMRGWLAAPLTTPDGRNLGVVQVSDKYVGDFTGADVVALVGLAEEASVAIERMRAQERTRRRATRPHGPGPPET
jgi:GAF domain-containing protein